MSAPKNHTPQLLKEAAEMFLNAGGNLNIRAVANATGLSTKLVNEAINQRIHEIARAERHFDNAFNNQINY